MIVVPRPWEHGEFQVCLSHGGEISIDQLPTDGEVDLLAVSGGSFTVGTRPGMISEADIGTLVKTLNNGCKKLFRTTAELGTEGRSG